MVATTQPAPAPHPALTCPRCGAPASPGAQTQRCPSCRRRFALRAGAAFDPLVLPPPVDRSLPTIKVKASGLLVYTFGAVEPEGVAEGALDPVTGAIPMNKSGVAFGDIITVAVWRRVALVHVLIALFLTLPGALTFLGIALSESADALVCGVPFAAFAVLGLYRAFGIGANYVRVAGRYQLVTVRFDTPLWRRRSFHDELLRRAGIAPGPIP